MYEMPLRDYDPASAKWFNIDPVTHYDQSPFMAMNGNPVTFSDPSGADGHNWNPYSDMSMNNYGANGTSSPGRNSNGDNDGGSSIFWGSSRMLFEQSFEGHLLSSMFTVTDQQSITAIYNYYAKQNGYNPRVQTGEIGGGYIVNSYEQYSDAVNDVTKKFLMATSEMAAGAGSVDAIATKQIINRYQNGGDVIEALTDYHGLKNLKAANKLFQRVGYAGWAVEGVQLGSKIYNDKDKVSDYLRFGISTALTFVAISNPVGIIAVGAYAAFDYYYGDQFWKATKIDY